MHIVNVESPLQEFARGLMCKGSVPSIPNPPPPPKPPAQQQAGANADAALAMQRKKQGYASTLLGGPASASMGPVQTANKTLLGS